MDTGKIILWLVLAVVALAAVNIVVSAVFAAIGFLWWLATTAVTLAVVGGLLYGAYRLYGLVSGDDETADYGGSRTTSLSRDTEYSRTDSGVDDVQTRYANGEISEAELERELERQMDDDGDIDSIDRELQRERSS
ncbi:Uncharacterized membrane protein [Halovenus aranensis]|uniref:Uncharacterized membrane protein n=1 Tax=Halovenus aranensis TaxID=890420 RepID=A0A1G8US42_9EURY|nr:hypothetical protein [Halovenus aranensis]SDJ56377.1 Uncharacterized membrane protein [Halovenus aranensis]